MKIIRSSLYLKLNFHLEKDCFALKLMMTLYDVEFYFRSDMEFNIYVKRWFKIYLFRFFFLKIYNFQLPRLRIRSGMSRNIQLRFLFIFSRWKAICNFGGGSLEISFIRLDQQTKFKPMWKIGWKRLEYTHQLKFSVFSHGFSMAKCLCPFWQKSYNSRRSPTMKKDGRKKK